MGNKESWRSVFRPVIILFILLCSVLYATAVPAQSRDLVKFENAKGHFKKGVYYYNNMQYLAAAEYFRKAVSVYPDYYTAREYLARSYKLSGFIEEALKEWEILGNWTTNNVFIANKIDTLRFRGMQAAYAPSMEFVLSSEHSSSEMKRHRFTHPVDLAVDRDKNLYVTSFSSGKLVKFDANGEGSSSFAPRIGSKLYGIDFRNDLLAVTDFHFDRVYLMNTDLKVIRTFGSPGNGEGQFHGPEGVCFDPAGYLYVVDSGNHRVQKFSDGGDFILKFGEPGEYEGQLQGPTDLAFYKDHVYVTDTGNKRIACFDDSGNFISNRTVPDLERPRGIGVYRNGLIISDEKKGLLFFNPDDGNTFWFNSWDKGKNSFSRLVAAGMDRDGFLHCLDYNKEKVYVFSPLQSRYTNLEVEITSVDLKKYPVVAYYLNVRNREGRPVYGLTPDNFKLVEDNARISGVYIDYLKKSPSSSSIVLCVDRSETNREHHGDIPWIAEFILKKMRKSDSLKVVNFNSDHWTGNDFDWSRRRALKALGKREYGEGKNIDRALYGAVGDLLARVNRRAVVLVTDGSVSENSFRRYSPQIIIEYARSHYIPIYIVSFDKMDPVLDKIARETGGELLKASQADGLRGIYDKIKNAEEYRYVLVYSTFKAPSLKGWWSDVKIEVNQKGQKGVEWGGYFVP